MNSVDGLSLETREWVNEWRVYAGNTSLSVMEHQHMFQHPKVKQNHGHFSIHDVFFHTYVAFLNTDQDFIT